MERKKSLFFVVALLMLLSSCAGLHTVADSSLPHPHEQITLPIAPQPLALLLHPPAQTSDDNGHEQPEESGEPRIQPNEDSGETGDAHSEVPVFRAMPRTNATEYTSELTIHFLDVGQADCILIELPNSQIMLIDGGSRSSRDAVLNYFRNLNIDSIDYLVITHPHEDHIGGLPDIIDSHYVGRIYMPRASHNTQIFERLLTAIQDNGLSINTARAGVNILSEQGLRIDIVAPVGETYRDLNDYSAVVRLTFNNVSFLFAGDAEAVSENEITENIQADVLKVSHHGSRTSTSESFLDKVSPSYAVISVGHNNTYGHPSEDVMTRLLDAGISVYRTDELGTIVITTDGDAININSSPSRSVNPGAHMEETPTQSPAPAPSPDQSSQQTEEAIGTIVYVTRTGTRYHAAGCRHLSQSQIEVTLDEARRSFEPCSVCRPPR